MKEEKLAYNKKAKFLPMSVNLKKNILKKCRKIIRVKLQDKYIYLIRLFSQSCQEVVHSIKLNNNFFCQK
jgi:hypothetical protein